MLPASRASAIFFPATCSACWAWVRMDCVIARRCPDDTLIYYAGLLAQRPRSAQALQQILADYFEVPVEIEQFAGGWYRLDRRDAMPLVGGKQRKRRTRFRRRGGRRSMEPAVEGAHRSRSVDAGAVCGFSARRAIVGAAASLGESFFPTTNGILK